MVGRKKHSVEITFKKLDQKIYRLFEIMKDYWTRSVSAKITRRMGNIQCVQ